MAPKTGKAKPHKAKGEKKKKEEKGNCVISTLSFYLINYLQIFLKKQNSHGFFLFFMIIIIKILFK